MTRLSHAKPSKSLTINPSEASDGCAGCINTVLYNSFHRRGQYIYTQYIHIIFSYER